MEDSSKIELEVETNWNGKRVVIRIPEHKVINFNDHCGQEKWQVALLLVTYMKDLDSGEIIKEPPRS